MPDFRVSKNEKLGLQGKSEVWLRPASHERCEVRRRPGLTAVLQGAGYATIGLVSLTAGGVWAAVRPPEGRTRSIVQHVAAGTVFAGLIVGVLSRLLRGRPEPWWLLLGLMVGLGTMMWIRVKGEGGAGSTLGLTILADVMTDGVLIGFTSGAGDPRSFVLMAGFVPEMTLLGTTLAAEFSKGRGWKRTIEIPFLVGCAVVAGGALGGWARSGPEAIGTVILAFGTIAISYLVVEELLREAHRSGATPWLAATFFVGFIPLFAAGVLLR